MTELTQTRGAVARRGGPDTYRAPFSWQVAAGHLDGRWGTQATRYEYMNGQCRYCGSHCEGPAHSVTAHPRALCLACATPQCDIGRTCLVCHIGFVGKVPYGQSSSCGYSGCGKPAVAKAPRVRMACRYHLIKAKSRGQTLDDQIANSLRLRDLGGLHWQKLTWFGPALRYAVRRWHDDGRSGWTTGLDPQGFETAGQADREAGAWNDPRSSDGWHAVRVTLSPKVWEDIRAWESPAMRELGKAVWSAENTRRELEDRRHERHVAWVRLWCVLGALAACALAILILTGCNSAPCAGHGGLSYWSGSWDYCNDGTVQPAG